MPKRDYSSLLARPMMTIRGVYTGVQIVICTLKTDKCHRVPNLRLLPTLGWKAALAVNRGKTAKLLACQFKASKMASNDLAMVEFAACYWQRSGKNERLLM